MGPEGRSWTHSSNKGLRDLAERLLRASVSPSAKAGSGWPLSEQGVARVEPSHKLFSGKGPGTWDALRIMNTNTTGGTAFPTEHPGRKCFVVVPVCTPPPPLPRCVPPGVGTPHKPLAPCEGQHTSWDGKESRWQQRESMFMNIHCVPGTMQAICHLKQRDSPFHQEQTEPLGREVTLPKATLSRAPSWLL